MLTFIISLIGFIVLALITMMLFSVSFFESLNFSAFITIFKTLVILALVYRIGAEAYTGLIKNKDALKAALEKKESLLKFLAVFVGTLLTFAINVELNLGPVVAASTVAIIATLIVPKYDVPVYCGAFVGMACPSVFYNYPLISLAGLTAGIFFVFSNKVFNGYGGKLGTIAFTGCIATTLVTRIPPIIAPIPLQETHLLLIIYSVAGALLTYLLNIRLGHSPVISSGIIGLMGGLFLPVMHPEVGEMFAIMVICASFVGMSSKDKVPNEAYMVIAGLFCALFFIYTSTYLGGLGGKLGTIAFGSAIAVRGLSDLFNLAHKMIRKKYYGSK